MSRTPGPSPAAGLSRRPALLAALVLVLALIALYRLAWVAVPLGDGLDELGHVGFARHVAQGNGLPAFQDPVWAGGQRDLYQAHQAPLYYLLAAGPMALVGGGGGSLGVLNLERDSQLDRGWYVTPGPGAWWDEPAWRGWLVARLVSVALGLVAAGATFAAGWSLRRAVPLAWLPATGLVVFLPYVAYQSATVANDVAAFAAGAVATWLAVRLLVGADDVRRSWWAWGGLGLAVGASILAKLSGVPLLVLAAGTVLAVPGSWRERGLRLGLAMAGVLLVAGWWLGRNLLLAGSLLPLQVAADAYLPRRQFSGAGEWLGQAAVFLPRTVAYAWGVVGQREIAAPIPAMLLGSALALLAGVSLGWHVVRRTVSPVVVRVALVLGATALTSWLALQVWLLQGGVGYEPRFLLPGLPALALLLGMGVVLPFRGRARLVAALVPVVLAALLGVGMLWTVLVQPAQGRPLVQPLPPGAALLVPTAVATGSGTQLVGWEAARTADGQAVEVVLYLRPEGVVPRDVDWVVQLVGTEAGGVLAEHRRSGGLAGADWGEASPDRAAAVRFVLPVPVGGLQGPAEIRVAAAGAESGVRYPLEADGLAAGDGVVLPLRVVPDGGGVQLVPRGGPVDSPP